MHVLDKFQFNHFLREARRLAQNASGNEICGLIVDTGHHLSFVQIRNVSRRAGSFVLSRPDVRRVASAVKIIGQKIVGTFHSHPAAIATPGKSDIQHAVDDSLMFIFDCIGKKGRLWKIKSGKARQLNYDFIK